jgi:hypothetical protein
MKRLIKKLIRTLWLISAPVHQRVIRKFDHHMIQLIRTIDLHPEAPANLDLALSSIVRELARLQIQVEILQQHIEDMRSSDRDGAHPERRLAVVGDIG